MRILVFSAITVFVLAVAGTALCQDAPSDKPPTEDQPGDPAALKKIIAEQKETIDRLTKELNEAKDALEKLKKGLVQKKEAPAESQPSTEQDTREQPQPKREPPLEGQITHARMEKKLVLVNLGENHNLTKGDVFEVVRAGKKIGKIKIWVVLQEDMSNAEVVEAKVDFLKGDKVVMIAPARQELPPAAKPEPARKPAQETPKTEEPSRTETKETTTEHREPGRGARTNAEELSRRLAALEGLYADLAEQVEQLEGRLEKGVKAAAEKDLRKSVPQAEPEKVERPSELKAKIVDVRETHVLLDKGAKDGVKKGDTFVIKRGEKEIAKVRVTNLIKEICRADFVSKNAEILKMRDIAILE